MSRTQGAPLTKRDVHMLVGFAFFAEAVLGWFLLVDPPLARLARLDKDLTVARQAHATLSQQRGTGAVVGDSDLGEVLRALPGEAPELAVQRLLERWVSAAGATPREIVIAQAAGAGAATVARRVDLDLLGRFEVITTFVSRTARPGSPVAVERLQVKPAIDGSDRLVVHLELLVRVESPLGAPRPAAPGLGVN